MIRSTAFASRRFVTLRVSAKLNEGVYRPTPRQKAC